MGQREGLLWGIGALQGGGNHLWGDSLPGLQGSLPAHLWDWGALLGHFRLTIGSLMGLGGHFRLTLPSLMGQRVHFRVTKPLKAHLWATTGSLMSPSFPFRVTYASRASLPALTVGLP